MEWMRVRGIISALGLVSFVGYAVVFPRTDGLTAYVGLFLALFILYLLAAWAVLSRPSEDRVVLGLILGFGLLFRLVLLPTPVILSSDLYRYLWDGRVQWAGINPYRYPPAAEELAGIRDPVIYPAINRPEKRTVYPPGSEALFVLVAGLAPDSIVAWRLFLLGCEIVTALLLLRLLGRMGFPRVAILLYSWAPLAVFEGVQAGHLEIVVIPVILLALLLRQKGRMALSGAALGVAILLKLYPAILLLAWWRRRGWGLPLGCGAIVLAGYLPYATGVGPQVVGFLPEYFASAEDFNIGLRFFLTEGIGFGGEVARGVVMLLLFGALLAVLVRIARRRAEAPEGILQAAMAAAGAYLLLVPTAMHAWYALWIVPFLVLRPSPAWLWFTGAVTLSYLKYAWEPAEFPLWARALEYLPLYLLLAWEWSTRYRRETRLVGMVAEPS